MKSLVFKIFVPFLLVSVAFLSLSGCGKSGGKNGEVYVYNWGEYIDPDTLDMFEEETGIKVIYDEYETNEIMYPKVESGAISYDILCPSDYMIQKLLENDLLQEINWDNVPNASNVGDVYFDWCKDFDPSNNYVVPYAFGTVGILYNTKMVDEPVRSWSVLFDEKYKDSILMQNSVRDALGITLKYLGYSLNSKNTQELEEARDLLISQKPLVQAYVVDEVRDKMIGNEAAIGVIYSGEALYCIRENEDLAYVVPEEGSNVWIDGWVIPKNAPNKENAEAFLNFMSRPDIAKINFEYLTYSTPNVAAQELIDDPFFSESEVAFPDLEALKSSCETFSYLGEEWDEVYNEYWKDVKSE